MCASSIGVCVCVFAAVDCVGDLSVCVCVCVCFQSTCVCVCVCVMPGCIYVFKITYIKTLLKFYDYVIEYHLSL